MKIRKRLRQKNHKTFRNEPLQQKSQQRNQNQEQFLMKDIQEILIMNKGRI